MDRKYHLDGFDAQIFKKWEDNYNINLANNFYGNWLKYQNFINIQWKKYSKKPLVVVFAGPSIDSNVKQLIPIRDKVVIMCVDVMVFKLLEHNIKPDIVVNVDPMNIVRFWDGWNGEDCIFIAPVTTCPENLKEWKGKKHLYVPQDFMYKDKHDALKELTKECKDLGNLSNAGFVGATILQIIKDLCPRPSPIMLLGCDFSFSNNQTYCSGFLDRRYPGQGREEEKNKEFSKELNVHGTWTSKQLYLYHQIFVQIAKNYNIHMINCTEGGILEKTEQIEVEKLSTVIEKFVNKQT